MSYHDDHPTACAFASQVGGNHVVEIGSRTDDHVFEAFSEGEGLTRNVSIARIVVNESGVVTSHWWRRHVKTATPQFELFHAEFVGSLLLVLARQIPIMAFIKPPRAMHREPRAPGRVECDFSSPNCAGEDRRVENPKVQIGFSEQPTTGSRFSLTLRGEINVVPASKEVGNVPLRLTMANKDELWHALSVVMQIVTEG